MEHESIWFYCWMIIFIILYCGVLAWPIVLIFIWEIEEKIKNMFKKTKE